MLEPIPQFGLVLAEGWFGRQHRVGEARGQDGTPDVGLERASQLGADFVENALVFEPEGDLGFTHGFRQAGGPKQDAENCCRRVHRAARHRTTSGEQAAVALAGRLQFRQRGLHRLRHLLHKPFGRYAIFELHVRPKRREHRGQV
jgi:hypothetical protein